MPEATSVFVPSRRPFSAGRVVRRIVFYALVVLVCAIVIFPVYWMILSAIQPARFSMRYPPPWWPQAPGADRPRTHKCERGEARRTGLKVLPPTLPTPY